MPNASHYINCPQCGNQLPLTFQYAKLTVCTHCDSTLFIEDDGVRLAGKQSVLSTIPSLLELGSPFSYHKTSFVPVGKVRYAHTIGYWEEWWVIGNSGKGFWISVDEGDFAVEKPLDLDSRDVASIPSRDDLYLGQTITLWKDQWQVTEIDKGKCEGFQGELPKILKVDDVVPFVHLSGQTGQLITLEYLDTGIEAFQGEWIDPFEIKREG